MTVEQILVPAVRYTDERGDVRHMVPLFDPNDGTWWVLAEDGASFFDDAASIRDFADEWDNDPHFAAEDETIAAYRMLADVIERSTHLASPWRYAPDAARSDAGPTASTDR